MTRREIEALARALLSGKLTDEQRAKAKAIATEGKYWPPGTVLSHGKPSEPAK